MLHRLFVRLLFVVAMALTLVACSRATQVGAPASAAPAVLPIGAVIDGHQVGPLLDCSTTCDDVLSFAEASAVSTRSLDPNDIRAVHVYVPFVPPGATSSGGGFVVVYDLEDGLEMGIRVHCGVGACQVVAPQPIDLPPPVDYSCKGSECVRCEGSVCTPWVPPTDEAEPTPSGIPESSASAG